MKVSISNKIYIFKHQSINNYIHTYLHTCALYFWVKEIPVMLLATSSHVVYTWQSYWKHWHHKFILNTDIWSRLHSFYSKLHRTDFTSWHICQETAGSGSTWKLWDQKIFGMFSTLKSKSENAFTRHLWTLWDFLRRAMPQSFCHAAAETVKQKIGHECLVRVWWNINTARH